jgi:hypothetical protein
MSDINKEQAQGYSSSESEEDDAQATQKQQELVSNIKSILKTGKEGENGQKQKPGTKIVKKEVRLIGKGFKRDGF